MITNNNGFFATAGHSSRLGYENPETYKQKLDESTSPLKYRINANQIYNQDRCFSLYGPNLGYQGFGNSIPETDMIATSQSLVDVDSVFSNRNVKLSKNRNGFVNPVDPIKMLKVQNAKICNNKLDPEYTLTSHPRSTYRGIETNRFYNLGRNPQEVLFWNFAVNSRLEATDNFVPTVPQLWGDKTAPVAEANYYKPCTVKCDDTPRCPSSSWNNVQMKNNKFYQPTNRSESPFYQKKSDMYKEFQE